jgi:D-alanyl-D-alanine-carboxypeptidase/D-alanyl-D-alanine-endopeptidase
MVFYKILVHGKDIISILFVIVILIGTLVVSPTLTSIYGSASASFANTSSQKKTEEPATFTISDKLKETIKSTVEKKNQTNAAIVIGLVDPNGTQFYGYGNLSNANPIPVDKDTIFAIASITKVFTTILLADMANRGLVNLEDPIEKYLPPNVKVPTYNGQKITLENLATHTSGLSEFGTHCMKDFDGFDTNIQNRHFFIECSKNYTFDQLYQDLSNTTLTREPGSKYVYSTFGIGLLGHILALKAGMSYDDLLKERILKVLGMNSTSFGLSEVQKSRLAIGHLNGQELPSWNLSRPIEPGGGLFSSMSDMLKFASANLGLIDTKITNAMKDSHIIIKEVGSGPEAVYFHNTVTDYTPYVGLGWIIATDFGTQIVEKNGESIGGYNSLIALNPAKERGLVIMASTDILDLEIAYYQYGAYDELSTLIWDLLTN